MTNENAFDVVIIGGGIIGASIAYCLAVRGMSNVIVIDRGTLGGGSTSKAPGGVRQQFGRDIEIRLAVESMKFWREFEAQTGQVLQFRQVGYLFLLTSTEEIKDFEARVALQREFAIPSRMLGPEEVADLFPAIMLDGVLAGSYCSTDGRISPADATYGYVRAARQLGVRFLEDVEVLNIRTAKHKISGVITSVGDFPATIVVNAAGPEAREVAAWVDVDLPVFPKRLHVVVTGPIPELSGSLPCIMEPATTLYIAPEGSGLLLTLDQDEHSESTEVDWNFVPEIARVAAKRIPSVMEASLQTAWAGLVELTPDGLPVLCKAREPEGFLLANGFSGHGVMLSPAVGKLASELIMDGYASSIDISELSLERFQ